jgi:hypothetical protein
MFTLSSCPSSNKYQAYSKIHAYSVGLLSTARYKSSSVFDMFDMFDMLDMFPIVKTMIDTSSKSFTELYDLIETKLGFKKLPKLNPATSSDIWATYSSEMHCTHSIKLPSNSVSVIGSRYETHNLHIPSEHIIAIFPFPLYHKFVVIWYHACVCQLHFREWDWFVDITLEKYNRYNRYNRCYGNLMITTGAMCQQQGFIYTFCNKFEAALLATILIENPKQLVHSPWYKITHPDLRKLIEQVIETISKDNKEMDFLHKFFRHVTFPTAQGFSEILQKQILGEPIGITNNNILKSELAKQMVRRLKKFRHNPIAFNTIVQNMGIITGILESSTANVFKYCDYIELVCCVDRSIPLEVVNVEAQYIVLN